MILLLGGGLLTCLLLTASLMPSMALLDCDPCIDRQEAKIQVIIGAGSAGLQDEAFQQAASDMKVQLSITQASNDKEWEQAIENNRNADILLVSDPPASFWSSLSADVPVFGMNLGRNDKAIGWISNDEYKLGELSAMEFANLTSAAYLASNIESPVFQAQFRGLDENLIASGGVQWITSLPSSCDEYQAILVAELDWLEGILNLCQDDQGKQDVMIGVAATGPKVYRALAFRQVHFAFRSLYHLQASLGVVLSAIFATTDKKLALPLDTGTYSTGPEMYRIEDIPSDSYTSCEAQSFPVCQGDEEAISTESFSCRCTQRETLRIGGVLHGHTEDFFWDPVYAAAEQAALDMGIDLDLNRFENSDILQEQMAARIRNLCDNGVDGIFVTIPSDLVIQALQRCLELQVPVVSINSGKAESESLGLVHHIGMNEFAAGYGAGVRMIETGMKEGYCLPHVVGISSVAERCDGFRAAIADSKVQDVVFAGEIQVSLDNRDLYIMQVENGVNKEGSWEGVGLLSISISLLPQLQDVLNSHPGAIAGSFDLSDSLYAAVGDEEILFGIDQQPFLQGALPVYLLAYQAYTREALLNHDIQSGPNFVESAPSAEQSFCEANFFEVCPDVASEDDQRLSSGALGAIYAGLAAFVVISFFLLRDYLVGGKEKSETMWEVKRQDLVFADPPEVLGKGTFGLVLLAEYRGTQVAVKRVLPSGERSSIVKSSRSSVSIFDPRTSVTVHGGIDSSRHTSSSGNNGNEITTEEIDNDIALGGNSAYGLHSVLANGRQSTVSKNTSRSTIQKLREDFVAEMRLLAQLRHPSITTVLGAVMERGEEPMLVMEYMDLGSLYDLLHNETMALDGEVLIPILRDITQGMRFLHSADPAVLHGDLKSANILVDSRFRAKVSDFGFSQKKGLGATGTPFWMAPELLRKESENTTASDIFSFGVILYEAFSRKDPYEGLKARDVLQAVANPSVQKRLEAPRHMPDQIRALMIDCYEEDPEIRPSFQEADMRLKRIHAENVENPQTNRTRSGQMSLFDIFPRHVAEALRDGRKVESEHKDCVTIFFSDIIGFTTISASLDPRKVANLLDRLYHKFDDLSDKHDVFKVETIGDAYMAVTNLVKNQSEDHASRIAEFAIEAVNVASKTLIDEDDASKGYVSIRAGFHSGSVVADVVGNRNPRYCLFGDAVNTASRMESISSMNRINCSKKTADILLQQNPTIPLKSRGEVLVKGKGKMRCYWVNEQEGNSASEVADRIRALQQIRFLEQQIQGQVEKDDVEGGISRETTPEENYPAKSTASAISVDIGEKKEVESSASGLAMTPPTCEEIPESYPAQSSKVILAAGLSGTPSEPEQELFTDLEESLHQRLSRNEKPAQ